MRPGSPIPEFDFMDLDLFSSDRTHQIWKILRAEAPLYWHERPRRTGFWLATKHADVVRVSQDTETFTSQRGVGPPDAKDLPPGAQARPLNLLDPPDHARLRRLVSRAFGPRTVTRFGPVVRSTSARVLNEISPWGSADFVRDFAMRVPLEVLGELMGLPREDLPQLAKWTMRRSPDYSVPGGTGTSDSAATRALTELTDYLCRLFVERRRKPRHDLVSELLTYEAKGQLGEADVLWFCLLLIGAGHETVRDALAGGVAALLKHRDQLVRLRNSPSLIDTAVEEILRWTSPIIFFGRCVARDTILREMPLRTGQRVLMIYPSANRDEEVFAQADRFDIGRQPNNHLAFGVGSHSCLGGTLARLQLRMIIPLVLKRLPKLELAGTPDRLHSNFNAGYSRMPIRFTPRRD